MRIFKNSQSRQQNKTRDAESPAQIISVDDEINLNKMLYVLYNLN